MFGWGTAVRRTSRAGEQAAGQRTAGQQAAREPVAREPAAREPAARERVEAVRASRGARFGSWLGDDVVVLAWLFLVFAFVGVPTLLGWVDLSAVWSRVWAADLAVTVLTVLPYLLYLVLTEAGPRHATWGKRRAGLAVARRQERAAPGGDVPTPRSAERSTPGPWNVPGPLGVPDASSVPGPSGVPDPPGLPDASSVPGPSRVPDPPGVPRVVLRNVVKVLPWQLGHMSAMRFAVAADAVPADAAVLNGASTLVLVAVALPPLLGRRGLHDVLAGTEVYRSGTVRPRRPASPAAPS